MSECNRQFVEEMAGVFIALGDYNRLCIIYFLANDQTGTLGVNDLAGMIGISQPAVSQHLKILKNVRIIASRKDGNHVYYSFNRESMVRYQENFNELSKSVMEKCRQDNERKANSR
ncbi:MAG: metalloregulator ArsR/SmtB family transcription factor [Methanoregulaceae archaeon]|jgi:DNA-binding transcriptional ArsR family regulator|nr:metalloregulator ArsR/SmtB family transcription factor [Methanoregulaceae archaeon]